MGNPQLVAFSAAGVENRGPAVSPQWLQQFERMMLQEQLNVSLVDSETNDSRHRSLVMGYAV